MIRKLFKHYNIPIIILFLISLIFFSRNYTIGNKTLKNIQEELNNINLNEKEAKTIYNKLHTISKDTLNEAERYLYTFLTIKAADKAYIAHRNDSAYLTVKEYFQHHYTELYPEVLYYGGRVYSDIGDYPTAIEYFNNALDNLNKKNEFLKLKAVIYSQMAQLQSNMRVRMYEMAKQSFLNAITIEKSIKDSIGLLYDYSDLGNTYMHLKDYDSALMCYRKSQEIILRSSQENINLNTDYIAQIYYLKGFNKEALRLIRISILKGDSLNWAATKSYAISIYLKAGLKDTAFNYAKELATREDSYAREYGYEMMLSPELIPYANKDSLPIYFAEYKNLLDHYYDNNQNQATLTQNASYNYQLHEKKRKEAEVKNIRSQKIIVGIIIIVLGLSTFTFYQKNRYQRKIIKLHKTLEKLKVLSQYIKSNNDGNRNTAVIENVNTFLNNDVKILTDFQIDDLSIFNCDTNPEELRNRIKEELIELDIKNIKLPVIPISLLESQSYNQINQNITENKIILEKNDLWKELEKDVLHTSPYFKQRLLKITGGRLKESDFKMALLIKCGFTPTQISILMGRGKSTISYRREKLCVALLGEKIDTKIIDYLIISL